MLNSTTTIQEEIIGKTDRLLMYTHSILNTPEHNAEGQQQEL